MAVKDSDVRWCSDGLELSCEKGEKVRVAFALDCCDREIMSWVATTKGIDAALVGDLMMQTVMAQLPKWFDDYSSYHPQRVGLCASQAVQGKTSGKLNIPAVLGYRVKTTNSKLLIETVLGVLKVNCFLFFDALDQACRSTGLNQFKHKELKPYC